MEQPRDVPREMLMGVREDVAALRATTTHLSGDVREVKQDIRRLDSRMFQLMLVQLATLGTALGSLVTALVAALGS